MGVGGELLGCDGQIECRITVRFSELYDLKDCNSGNGEKYTVFIGVLVHIVDIVYQNCYATKF